MRAAAPIYNAFVAGLKLRAMKGGNESDLFLAAGRKPTGSQLKKQNLC
jgi:hypothetical protein